jgi:hypothetical protein
MAQKFKTLDQQERAMCARRPEFELAPILGGRIAWFGPLIGLARTYRVMIEYGPVPPHPEALFLECIPLVRIISPRLEP